MENFFSEIFISPYFWWGIWLLLFVLVVVLIDAIFIPTAILSIISFSLYFIYLMHVAFGQNQQNVALFLLIVLLILVPLLAFVVIRFRLYRTVLFDQKLQMDDNRQQELLIGKVGVAISDLRPSGKVEIDGDIYDALSQDEFLKKGTVIRVLSKSSSQVVVEMASGETKEDG